MDPRAGRARGVGARKFFAGVRAELTAYCAHQRRLARVEKDGTPYRTHLEAAARAGSRAAQLELEGPPLPAACAYVWTWFCELHQARAGTGYGDNPLSYTEIASWARLTGRRLARIELAILRELDHTWMTAAKEKK